MPANSSGRIVESGTGRSPRDDALILLGAAIVLVFFRLHAFDLPLETDECNYAYIGGRLLEGDRLYVDVWDHQPPGAYTLFAGAMALFGDSPGVFRWLATAASLVTLACLYGCGLRIAGRPGAACAAALFAVMSADPGTGGEGCNREIFMNALIALAWALVLWTRRPATRSLFAAGLVLGLASAIKTVVAVHWLALAVAVVVARIRPHNGKGSPLMSKLAALGAGPALVWSVVLAYFAVTGRFSEAFEAVFAFNVGYSGGDGAFLKRFAQFFNPPRHPFVFDSGIALWVLTIVSALWGTLGSLKGRRGAAIVITWLVGAYVAACLPGRFWPHYYYLLIPPACLSVAMLTARLADALAARGPVSLGEGKSVELVRALVLAAPVVACFATQYRDYLSQPPFGITVKRYNSRDFWGRAQGENIRRVTRRDDTVFVYGNEASLYYYARRRCASRYTMITGLSEGMPGAIERRRHLIDELRADPPRLIVVLFDEPPFDEWKRFLDEYYGEPVGWDFHDATREPIMFVMVRKDRPIEAIDWDWDRNAVGGWQLGDEHR